MRSKLSKLFLAAIAVGSIGAGNLARAQTETMVREPDQIVPAKTTVIIFGAQGIDGAPAVPTITYGLVPKAGPFQCMVKVRKNFLPEAQDSVSNL